MVEVQVIVKGRNIGATKALRDYAKDKLSRVTKYFNQIAKMEVELMVERNPSIADNQTVEVTLFTRGPVIRAKQSSRDMYASIDKVAGKVERQIKKYKGKLYSSSISRNTEQGALLESKTSERGKSRKLLRLNNLLLSQ